MPSFNLPFNIPIWESLSETERLYVVWGASTVVLLLLQLLGSFSSRRRDRKLRNNLTEMLDDRKRHFEERIQNIEQEAQLAQTTAQITKALVEQALATVETARQQILEAIEAKEKERLDHDHQMLKKQEENLEKVQEVIKDLERARKGQKA